jgi:hypothetical protein
MLEQFSQGIVSTSFMGPLKMPCIEKLGEAFRSRGGNLTANDIDRIAENITGYQDQRMGSVVSQIQSGGVYAYHVEFTIGSPKDVVWIGFSHIEPATRAGQDRLENPIGVYTLGRVSAGAIEYIVSTFSSHSPQIAHPSTKVLH